ncbi:MAG: monovalent cation/H+ antiporter complex subunit F [Agathobacter sp.]
MELVQQNLWIFYVILIMLAVMLIACLIRAIIGPRIADRLVAVNMITTMVMAIVSILAIVMNEGYLVDICLIYAMISFLAVVVLTKVYTGVYLEQKEKQKENLQKGDVTDGNS